MLNKETENKWKRFLDWVNKISPWNLWHSQDWQNEKIDDRRLNPQVRSSLEDLIESSTKIKK